jgi:hypothetical protein
MTGGISKEKNGATAFALRLSTLTIEDDLSIKRGSDKLVVKYEKKPEKRVDPYAIKTVIPRSLPAPFPSSDIPGATKPSIINGIMNPRKLEKSELSVMKTLVRGIGKINEDRIPKIIAIITLVRRPILILLILPAF